MVLIIISFFVHIMMIYNVQETWVGAKGAVFKILAQSTEDLKTKL